MIGEKTPSLEEEISDIEIDDFQQEITCQNGKLVKQNLDQEHEQIQINTEQEKKLRHENQLEKNKQNQQNLTKQLSIFSDDEQEDINGEQNQDQCKINEQTVEGLIESNEQQGEKIDKNNINDKKQKIGEENQNEIEVNDNNEISIDLIEDNVKENNKGLLQKIVSDQNKKHSKGDQDLDEDSDEKIIQKYQNFISNIEDDYEQENIDKSQNQSTNYKKNKLDDEDEGDSQEKQNIEEEQEEQEEGDGEEGEQMEEYEVESIVKHKYIKGNIMYFIKWKGWGSNDNTWEPEESLIGCQEILNEYNRKLEMAQQSKNKGRKISAQQKIVIKQEDDSGNLQIQYQSDQKLQKNQSEQPTEENNKTLNLSKSVQSSQIESSQTKVVDQKEQSKLIEIQKKKEQKKLEKMKRLEEERKQNLFKEEERKRKMEIRLQQQKEYQIEENKRQAEIQKQEQERYKYLKEKERKRKLKEMEIMKKQVQEQQELVSNQQANSQIVQNEDELDFGDSVLDFGSEPQKKLQTFKSRLPINVVEKQEILGEEIEQVNNFKIQKQKYDIDIIDKKRIYVKQFDGYYMSESFYNQEVGKQKGLLEQTQQTLEQYKISYQESKAYEDRVQYREKKYKKEIEEFRVYKEKSEQEKVELQAQLNESKQKVSYLEQKIKMMKEKEKDERQKEKEKRKILTTKLTERYGLLSNFSAREENPFPNEVDDNLGGFSEMGQSINENNEIKKTNQNKDGYFKGNYNQQKNNNDDELESPVSILSNFGNYKVEQSQIDQNKFPQFNQTQQLVSNSPYQQLPSQQFQTQQPIQTPQQQPFQQIQQQYQQPPSYIPPNNNALNNLPNLQNPNLQGNYQQFQQSNQVKPLQYQQPYQNSTPAFQQQQAYQQNYQQQTYQQNVPNYYPNNNQDKQNINNYTSYIPPPMNNNNINNNNSLQQLNLETWGEDSKDNNNIQKSTSRERQQGGALSSLPQFQKNNAQGYQNNKQNGYYNSNQRYNQYQQNYRSQSRDDN